MSEIVFQLAILVGFIVLVRVILHAICPPQEEWIGECREMKKFQDAEGPYRLRSARGESEATWVLAARDQVVTRIQYKSGIGECAEGKWRFEERWGQFYKTLHVREAESSADVGKINLGSYKWLELGDGRRFRWYYFYQRFRRFEDEHGTPLVRFHLDFCGRTLQVQLEPAFFSVPGSELLVVVGCYLFVSNAETPGPDP